MWLCEDKLKGKTALFCSNLYPDALHYMISRQKNAGFQMQGCHAIFSSFPSSAHIKKENIIRKLTVVNKCTRVAKCNSSTRFPAKEKWPEHSRPQRLSCLPTSTPTVCAGERMYVMSETKISRLGRFPKKPYPRCSAGALCARELCY